MPGTISRGIRAPMVREGDDIVGIVADSIEKAMAEEGFSLRERDVVAVTESVVARADGNYCTVDDIASDVRRKLGGGVIGVVFPILSRNRFAICLRGIARGAKKIVLMLSYPSDEVGNALFSESALLDSGVDPYADVLSLEQYREKFGFVSHPFTGVDYVDYYQQLMGQEGCEAQVVFANRPEAILDYAQDVLCADIHSRETTARRIREAGGRTVLTLAELLNEPVNGSGSSPFGLLGSNKASETRIKLFPRNAQAVAEAVQAELLARTGVKVEAMVYGDGAFKDPVGKIWELADPMVGVGWTAGLNGMPSELKIKYLADNDFARLSGDELTKAVRSAVTGKPGDLRGMMASEGTTPRRLTDLLGSLADLTSGSGDKGTPIVLIQNYFSNYAD